MKTLKEEYLDYLEKFTASINDEMLLSKGIKSIAIMQEVMTENPMPLRLLVKKLDETQYTIDGLENIPKHLNELFKEV